MKIKLISPPTLYFKSAYANFPFPLPYGPGILCAFLKENGYPAVLEDLSIAAERLAGARSAPPGLGVLLNILHHEKEVLGYLAGRGGGLSRKIDRLLAGFASFDGFDLIGISVQTYYHFLFALLLNRAAKSNGRARVVLGGPLISMFGKELFAQFPSVDYMIAGDGQIPLLRLAQHLEGKVGLTEVPNLLFNRGGVIAETPVRRFPIEETVAPDFSDLPLDFYLSRAGVTGLVLPYNFSRGCAHNCCFCDRGGPPADFECKSLDKAVAELKTMKSRTGLSSFRFYDYNLNTSYQYLEELCDRVTEAELGITWGAAAKTDNLDRRIIRKMRRAGCTFLSLGIESGSNRILDRMHKGFDSGRASRTLKELCAEGIRCGVHFLVGFPHERKEDIELTCALIRENAEHIDMVTMPVPLRVVASTALYEHPGEFGIENLRPVFNRSFRLEFRYFAFDEIGGLKWEKKLRQQKRFYRLLLKAYFRFVLKRRFNLRFVPFAFYFWLRERPDLVQGSVFLRFLVKASASLKKDARPGMNRSGQHMKIAFLSLLCGCLLLAGAQTAFGRDPGPDGIDPGIFEHLSSDERREMMQPEQVLAAMKIRPAMNIVDIGAGIGNFTFRFADALKGSGRVFATDIKPEMIAYLNRRAAEGNYRNVFPVLVKPEGVDGFYRNRQFDVMFVCGTYMLLPDPETYFRELRPSLKEGTGRLYIIEYRELPGFSAEDFEGFEHVVAALRERGEGYPVFRRLSKPVRDYIARGGAGPVPEEIRALMIGDFNAMLADRFLLRDMIVSFFKEGTVEEDMLWIKRLLHFVDISEVGLVDWLVTHLDEAGVFNARAKKLSDGEREQLGKLNKILLLRAFGLTATSTAGFDFRCMIHTKRNGIVGKLKAAGYRLVREYHFLPRFFFLEFRSER